MRLRKINDVLSLITTVFLLDHAIFLGAWMLSMGRIPKNANFLPRIMTGLMVIHAVISIALGILGHKGAEKRKCKGYGSLNRQTYIQRITGMLLIVFTWLHIAGTVGIMTPPQFVHATVPPLFFTLVMVHIAISTNKAFITLGAGSAKSVKALGIAIKVICAVTLVADIVGFYLYVC